jgi:hypothetical protein
MNTLSSFGWWILLIAAWFETFFIGAWMNWIHHYTSGDVHVINAVPYCLFPAVFMLFGLALVYLGKKRNKGKDRKRNKDRFELEDIMFHQRVKQGYLEMSKADPKLWMVIDGSLSKNMIERIIWDKVVGLLPKR